MKQKIIAILFFLLECVCSFFAWQSLHQSVLLSGSSHFLIPSILFSLLAIFLLVGVVLFPLPLFRSIAIGIAVLPLFAFGWSVASLVAVPLSFLFCYRSLSVIDRELSEHVTVRFLSSARMGTFLLSLGFSVMIVAGYATLIKSMPLQKLLPRFTLADGTGRVVLQIAGKVNPAFSRLVREDMSVDDFISEMMPQEMMNGSSADTLPLDLGGDSLRGALSSFAESRGLSAEDLMNEQKTASMNLQKELFLKETKRRLSDILSREIAGDERAKDVLSEMINAKIFGTVTAVQAEGTSVDALRAILSLLLFLSLLSLGSLLGFVWAFCAWVFFWILQGASIVAIRRIPIEAEQIVLVD
jgi:hypothetical protein